MSVETFSCPDDPRLDALAKRWHQLEVVECSFLPVCLSDAAREARVDSLATAAAEVAVEIADTPAATVMGALLKLLISDAMDRISEENPPGRLLLGAIIDLKRLTTA